MLSKKLTKCSDQKNRPRRKLRTKNNESLYATINEFKNILNENTEVLKRINGLLKDDDHDVKQDNRAFINIKSSQQLYHFTEYDESYESSICDELSIEPVI